MINIKVLFFASFKERLNCDKLQLSVEDSSNLTSICSLLASKGDEWQTIFVEANKSVKIACNQQMIDFSYQLKEGDEIAFFPPVTGG